MKYLLWGLLYSSSLFANCSEAFLVKQMKASIDFESTREMIMKEHGCYSDFFFTDLRKHIDEMQAKQGDGHNCFEAMKVLVDNLNKMERSIKELAKIRCQYNKY